MASNALTPSTSPKFALFRDVDVGVRGHHRAPKSWAPQHLHTPTALPLLHPSWCPAGLCTPFSASQLSAPQCTRRRKRQRGKEGRALSHPVLCWARQGLGISVPHILLLRTGTLDAADLVSATHRLPASPRGSILGWEGKLKHPPLVDAVLELRKRHPPYCSSPAQESPPPSRLF